MPLLHFAAVRLLPNASHIVLAVCLASSVGACANQQPFDLPIVGPPSATKDIAKGERTDKSRTPGVPDSDAGTGSVGAAIAVARAKRTQGDAKGAMVLLERSALEHASDKALQRERGILALELGQIDKAALLLRQALDHSKPDWQTHSAFGAALASAGRHREAQEQFAKALALSPDHPSILNNLALSYALDRKPAEAERLLRKAAARQDTVPQVRKNLALVLGINGKLAEAEKRSKSNPPRANAEADTVRWQSLSGQTGAGAADTVQTAEVHVVDSSSHSNGATNRR